MIFRTFTDHRSFSKHVIDLLLRDESTNNILLSMVDDPEQPANTKVQANDLFYCSVDDGVTPVFVGARRAEFHLVIQGNEDPQVVECAVNGIVKHLDAVKGVIGPRAITEAFAHKFAELSDNSAALEMEQLIYELDSVNPIELAPGSFRFAGSSDTPLLLEWFSGFHNDIGAPRNSDQIRDRVLGMIARKTAYIWEHESVPVSVAVHSRSTRNGAAISGVYTPAIYRGRGYATTCVWSLAKQLLSTGYSHCCLYTDANFPTSNRIYKRIGFREVASSIVYRFA